ncbi:O-antigen ligase family protein [Deinococcus petrolearius]|uniref:O-antigen ligase family protein n=1 Tax=Deinococcus petrolearius TaxID=1751295 RepID=A0ABW1DLN2_9DEIO
MLLLLGLFGLPLLINPVITLSFDEVYLGPKVWWIYGVIVPASMLLLWQGKQTLSNSRSILLLSLWSAWLVLSALLNGGGGQAWWGNPDRADGVLMHLVYALVLLTGFVWASVDSASYQRWTPAVLLGGSLLALTNIQQQMGLLGIPGEGAVSGVVATLYGGTLGHRGYLGGALALLLPVAAATVPRSRSWWLIWSVVTLMSWAWAGSFTRGAWLAGALGLIWLVLWQRKRVPWRTWGAVALGIVLCVVTAQVRGAGRSFSISGTATSAAVPAQALADSSGRGVLWNSALFGIQRRPLWGWGTPALLQAMNARSSEKLLAENGTRHIEAFRKINRNNNEFPNFLVTYRDGRKERVFLGGAVNKVHNEYLDYALTYGLPAALAFTVLLGWAIWSSRVAAPALSAGLVAYAAYLFTWPEVVRFAPIAWFFMGVALAAGASTRRAAVKVQPCPSPPSKNGTPSPGS